MRKRTNETNIEYEKLIRNIDKIIRNNPIQKENQGIYVEKIQELERALQNNINALECSDEIYLKFHQYVTVTMNNILRAKPFFRESESTFNGKIAKIFKTKDASQLKNYSGNYLLMSFLMTEANKIDSNLQQLNKDFEEYTLMRQHLIECNLGMAVNRAILFHNKTNSTSTSVVDLVNICVQGLGIAMDKFQGPYKKVFMGVCIGAMTRMMIENNMVTLTKLPSGDKKILYRVNIYRFRKKIDDIDQLTLAINNSYQEDKNAGKKVPRLPISKEKIQSLIDSADGKEKVAMEVDDSDSCYYDMELQVEKRDLSKSLFSAIKTLTIVESKLLKLKGVG